MIRATEVAGFPALVAGERRDGRPAIILIHGAFSHAEHFRLWLEPLAAQGYSVIAPTLRAPGASVERLAFADYLAAATAIIANVASDSQLPTVIGHSLGGLVAQKLAESGACGAAVLVASAPAGMLTAQPRSLPYLLPLFPRILAGLRLKASDATLQALVLHGIPEVDRTALLGSFVEESGIVYRQMIFGVVRVDPAHVRCPVLCVGGTADRVVSRRLLRSTAWRLHAPLREYSGKGHWLIAEPGWQELIVAIVSWLQERGRSQ